MVTLATIGKRFLERHWLHVYTDGYTIGADIDTNACVGASVRAISSVMPSKASSVLECQLLINSLIEARCNVTLQMDTKSLCVFAHQQPYQPPPQQAYQQQVPHHHPQAGSVPQGHAPQGGVPQGHAPQGGVPQGQQANLLRDKTHVQDREHIKEHLQGVVNQPDVSKMSEEELQFHYFKMHDNDDNNKLDGCELIKSVLHWHVEESNAMGANAPEQGTTKIFQDNELSLMIDPILDMDDRNKDGFIDYPEFVNAQKSRGL
ncbi:multiple coagulation factor deficiency protein 2 [Caerostris extrusa]|uniref:Multiple coagulation factor deficiency protein 2 n=1 Tax=Caerostris extrusa TaxID=172846 RepID=A0AAV4NQF3_CAEEX|nr:multiple coagulation factor deficiency protein 2 [Caerostris extrusa]